MTIFVRPTRTVPPEDFKEKGAMVPTMYYQRGSEIVKEPGFEAIAVRGTLEVRGQKFDTIERAGGYVYLSESGTPYLCHMEESPTHNKRHQIRPIHTKHNTSHKLASILIHPGNKPSHFVGCIGVGKKSAAGLSSSRDSMSLLFELLGGFKSGAEVWLEVSGEMVDT